MEWNSKAGKNISTQQAQAMIDKYQKANKGVRSVYFDLEIIKKLISTKGTAGISIFFAKNDNDDNTLVLYPVDEAGKIIQVNSESQSGKSSDTAVNVGAPCPPYCPG